MVQVNLEIVLVNLHAVEETRALAGRADDEHVLVDGGGRGGMAAARDAGNLILFPDSTAPSACAFSLLASAHST